MKYSAAILALTLAGTSAVELTPENWAGETAGKAVFLKFFAPWCGHCKALKPAWDKLTGEFGGSDIALIGKVDCTAGGKPLCDANGVKGFPTLKYGDPDSLEDYQGGRDFDTLKKFADENLKPMCSPTNIDLCDDEKKAAIEELQALSDEDLQAKIKVEEQKIEDAEHLFEAELAKLQATYEKISKDKDATIAEVKASGLGLMKAVKAAKK